MRLQDHTAVRTLALGFVVAACLGVAALPSLVISSIPQVEVMEVRATPYQPSVTVNGSLEAGRQENISLSLPAVISQVEVEIGDRVTAGQTLFTIDQQETKNSWAVQSVFGSVLLPKQEEGEQPDVSTFLQSFLENDQQMSGFSEIIGEYQQQIQEVLPSLGNASASGLFSSELPDLVSSPIDGVITSLSLEEGELAGAYTPLVSVARVDDLRVKATVYEEDIAAVSVGQKARIEGNAFRGKNYEGVVTKIAPTAEKSYSGLSQETTVAVELLLQNADDLLKPGYSIAAEIYTGQPQMVMQIPYRAVLQDEENMEYVYVVQNGKAIRRDIEVQRDSYEGVIVSGGLSEGEQLVLEPGLIAEDSMTVICCPIREAM